MYNIAQITGKEEEFRGKAEVKMTSRQRSYVILKETIPPYKVDTEVYESSYCYYLNKKCHNVYLRLYFTIGPVGAYSLHWGERKR